MKDTSVCSGFVCLFIHFVAVCLSFLLGEIKSYMCLLDQVEAIKTELAAYKKKVLSLEKAVG